MKRLAAIASILFFTVAACNSKSTVGDETDSVTKINGNVSVNQSNWGEPSDLNKDTIPIPADGTQLDTSHNR